eukprot:2923763-Amphidinium_carterae.1
MTVFIGKSFLFRAFLSPQTRSSLLLWFFFVFSFLSFEEELDADLFCRLLLSLEFFFAAPPNWHPTQ